MLASCQQESPIELSKSNGKECTLSFKVNIPESQVYSRNVFNNGTNITIDNLYLLVFDEHGVLQAKYAAENFATDIEQGQEYEYKVTVVPRSEKTIIHFIANCPVNYDNIPLNKSESELIQSLTTVNEKTAYWQRMELDYLGEDGSDEDTNVDNLPTVYLIRNFAAIQVREVDDLNFLQAYDLVNVPQKGTVAPVQFTASTGFANYPTDNSANNYETLTNSGYYGAEPQGNTYTPSIAELPDNIDNTSELYLYERNHQGVGDKDITFLIVKGYYNDNVANNGDDIWYYRVDFAENFEYLNILRNFRYIITIKSVTGKGYNSPKKAANGNSVNNIDVDIEVEKISDGTHYLFVTPTAITVLNQQNKTITFNYETDENRVTCPFTSASETSGAFNVVTAADKGTDNKGTISVQMKYYPRGVPNQKQNQTFKVKTPSGLYREVKVTLIDGFEFQNVTFTQNNEGNYEYSFTIPAGLEKSMFPLELFLFEKTCSFSPLGDDMSVKLVNDNKNENRQTWGYFATLDWEEYNQETGSSYTYKFKANTTIDSNKTMTISNEYAKQDGTATYTPPTTITITGNDIVDNTLTWYVGDTTPKTISINITPSNDVTLSSVTTTNGFTINEQSLAITPPATTSEGVLTVTASDGTTKTLNLKVLERPLDMDVEFGDGTQYYGSGKTFTLRFTTNKTGKYKVTNANFKLNGKISSDESPLEFDATADTPIDVNCETTTWSEIASITIEYQGDEAGGINPETWTGRTRNRLLIKTKNSNYSGGNTTFKLYSSKITTNSNWNNATKCENTTTLENGVEFEIPNLDASSTYYLAYRTGNNNNNRVYYNVSMKVSDFANEDVDISFSKN